MSESPVKLPKTPTAPVKTSKQYDLFTTFFGDESNLSNTIELYDAIPKYAVSARIQANLRDKKGNLGIYKQEFEYRPTAARSDLPSTIKCKVTIQPATIENPDGSYTQFFPSTDEELVEEVLKKIFSDHTKLYGIHSPSSEESWVRFSLYMIQKELKARGKTRSIAQIKQSLEILSKTTYEVQLLNHNGKDAIYTHSILNDMVRVTRANYLEDPSAMWHARLPALVSKSINQLAYRQINFGILMSLSSQLARWFLRRMSLVYTQANILTPYHIAFTTIKRDSGLLNHSRTSENVKTVDKALTELVKVGVLLKFEKEERRKGTKISEIIYNLTPTSDFSSEIKAANARQGEHRVELGLDPPTTNRNKPRIASKSFA